MEAVSSPSTSGETKEDTNSESGTVSRQTSLKGILKRGDSQLILKVPIKDPERESIISQCENGSSVDNGSISSVRFSIETENVVDAETKPKKKRKNTKKPQAPPQVSSFVNPAFEKDEPSQKVKLAELVEQLIEPEENEQDDCHPFGRGNVYEKAFHGKASDPFFDSGKAIMWFVLAVMMLGMAGGIIVLSESRTEASPVNTTTTLTL